MERLTERSLDYCTQLCSDEDAISCAFYKGEQEEKCWRANMYDRLAAYEDTGLEPEEVKEITSWSYGPCETTAPTCKKQRWEKTLKQEVRDA